jgi:hypothetical protein
MKRTPLLVLTFLTCVTLSCKKTANQENPPEGSEAFYKAKLERLVHLTPISAANAGTQTTAATNTQAVTNFKSYKEAYEALAYVEKQTVFTRIDSVQLARTTNLTANALTTNDVPITTTYNFSQAITDATSISGSLIGTLSDAYMINYTAGYTKKENGTYSYQGLSNNATTPKMAYGGIGTVTATNPIMTTGVYTGNFAGNLQGNIVIMSVPFSLQAHFNGNYAVNLPANPGQAVIISHALYASAWDTGGGGGGTNPPQ